MSELVIPKSKSDVTKMITNMRVPKISVLTSARKTDRQDILREFDKLISKGDLTIVFITNG
jgi:hypothetical protein